ncbi:hypothetical protein M3_0056 [Lysinibacillus phage vB_LfM_LysYB1]|nr:hypothetical protein M3_0056 [Lysinibacillus phage vB_LfM_LysYB1]WAB25201.1 hypothetical protein M5_0023 [Lysinibacillus phage vB_LfM_LysYB2]
MKLSGKPFLEGQLIIGVDFDGTITQQPDMADTMTLQPECKRVLEKWKYAGVRLVLWTCRTGTAFDNALAFLEANDMLHLFDAVNDQLPEMYEKYEIISRKLGADIYIDDRNLGCVIDWKKFEAQLEYLIQSIATSRI